jgi:hypothetical protein
LKDLEDHPVPTLAELLLHGAPEAVRSTNISFSNPDLQYLYERSGLNHRFIGRCLRIFGEQVVIEGLRRCRESSINEPAQAFGLFRNVESEGRGG